MFAALARFSYRFRVPVLVVFLILLPVAAFVGSGVFDALRPGGYDDPSTESFEARQLALEKFGLGRADVVALYTVEAGVNANAAAKDAIKAAVERAAADPHVLASVSGVSGPTANAPQFFSKDGTRTFAVFTLEGDERARIDATDALEKQLVAENVTTEFGGEIPVFEAFNGVVEKDLRRAELIAFPITAILLLIIFRSAVAAAVPLVLGVLAIVLALATLRAIASVTAVSVFALNVVTVLGLGLAIDYSLFILNRYREEARERSVEDAVVAAVSTSGKAVAFSGVTLATSLIGLFVFPQTFLRSLAFGGIAVTVVAVIIATTALPALLGLLGPRIERFRLPIFGKADEEAADSAFWHAVAFGVMKRPVLVAVLVVGLLLLLGSPFLQLKPSKQDARALKTNEEARRVSDVLNSEFLPHETTPHLVMVEFPTADLTADRVGELFDYVAILRTVPGITRVDSPFSILPGLQREQYQQLLTQPQQTNSAAAAALGLFVKDNAVRLSLVSDGEIDDTRVQAQVAELRDVPPPAGARVLVGGNAADLRDTKASIAGRLPYTLGIIAAATFIVLFLVFGSITLPVKAMIMNLLSITASFGAIVFVFQEGRFESILHYESLGTIDVTLPLLMFAIVFGLSMDYEVFMLSRVREEYERTGDNTLAVARGLEKTGKLITSAAALLVVVIGAFATSDIALMKALGVGMALAIALDATIVRALLVPATMRLMGHWNWWAPGPLHRLWERLGLGDLEGGAPPPPARGPRPPLTPPAPALGYATASGAYASPPQPGVPVARPAAPSPMPMRPALASVGGPMSYLVVRSGPEMGKMFRLDGAGTKVGRAPDNDIIITDPAASARHAIIRSGGDGALVIEDAGSTNGTLVRGERLAAPARIDEDTEIRIGKTVLQLVVAAAEGSPQTVVRPVSMVPPTGIMPRLPRLLDYLVVLEGDDAGKVFQLDGHTVGLGRDPRNQVVLPDSKVSGFHARIQRGLDGGLVVEDRNSTNGTYLNGTLLEDAARLADSDIIQVGLTRLQFKRVP